MNLADQKALWAVCEHQWKRAQARWAYINLPWIEWEEIKAAAFAHVFNRAKRYNPDKGSPEAWAAVIIRRLITNGLRDRKVFKPRWHKRVAKARKVKARLTHEAKLNLRFAAPLSTTVKEIGRFGEEMVVVEPDIAVPRPARDWSAIKEFRALLPDRDKELLDMAINGFTICEAAKRARIKRSHTYVFPKQLNAQWKSYLAGKPLKVSLK